MKYQDAKNAIENQENYEEDAIRNEMLLMCLDLMKELDYQMKWWDLDEIEEGAQKEKADEGAKQ